MKVVIEMTFEFKPAKRENVGLLISLAGASGSGKTYSALQLATGLSPSGRIAFIDTEARRGLHYASEFNFLHADMKPPFRPERFLEAIREAERQGAEVVIIDSMSHEYDGEGGILDWATELEEGTPKAGITHPRDPKDGDGWKDWAVKPVKSPGNWKEPKMAHKEMMNGLLQCRAHIIFCLRADEKISIVAPSKENGYKTQIVPMGWTPIAEKRFIFEMTLSLTLRPDNVGKPDYSLPHKIQDQHRPFLPEGRFITSETGRKLAEWARGDEDSKPVKPQEESATPAELAHLEQLHIRLEGAAAKGKDAFLVEWQALAKSDRQLVSKEKLKELQDICAKHDEGLAE